ncbi:MAG: TIGR04376 family protein [Xenococcaceae cyanobacterium MO_188.B29]|nr:TIGR04376 family protein [Xenococcaceae cyanobacterium MO_188.B29]
MTIFNDLSQFLEERLDEFLENNPHLELQAIEEQLREQERDTNKLIIDLQLQEKNLQEQILAIAEDIKTWHIRVSKAQAANRRDLAEAAQEREAALLRQGNLRWGQMEGIKKRIVQAKELRQQIQQRRKQIQAQAQTASNFNNTNNGYTVGWNQGFSNSNYSRAGDPLESKFQKWELDEELEKMKRNMGK